MQIFNIKVFLILLFSIFSLSYFDYIVGREVFYIRNGSDALILGETFPNWRDGLNIYIENMRNLDIATAISTICKIAYYVILFLIINLIYSTNSGPNWIMISLFAQLAGECSKGVLGIIADSRSFGYINILISHVNISEVFRIMGTIIYLSCILVFIKRLINNRNGF
ncbi:MAG: hypothetical protein KAH32_03500 [Chlamydiia bacterium]|nr:hypothetical protein [Chlamydiia bacterium]